MVSRTEKNKTKHNKIKKEEASKKRKHFIVNFFKVSFAIVIIIFCICSYVYYESTSMLEVREYSNAYENLPENFHGFKIIQFGDLYYDNNYKTILKTLKSTINKLKPNMIVFTGGLIHHSYKLSDIEKEKLISFFDELNSDVGKYFVVSSKDNEESIDILTKGGFEFLDDKEKTIFYGDSNSILIYGINQKYNVTYSKDNAFKITILNDCSKIEEVLSSSSQDIIMAGKSLNGQLKVPYGGGLIFKKRSTYYDRYYEVNGTDIYVTGGIGTNNYPIRTFNHPSINLYRLKSK